MRLSVPNTFRGKINGRMRWVSIMGGLVVHGDECCPHSNKVRKGDALDFHRNEVRKPSSSGPPLWSGKVMS